MLVDGACGGVEGRSASAILRRLEETTNSADGLSPQRRSFVVRITDWMKDEGNRDDICILPKIEGTAKRDLGNVPCRSRSVPGLSLYAPLKTRILLGLCLINPPTHTEGGSFGTPQLKYNIDAYSRRAFDTPTWLK